MNARPLAVALILAAAGCPAVSYPDTCTVGGATISRQAANPQNACQVCLPQARSDDWSEAPAGSPCGDGGAICFSGTCQSGCLVAPVFYATGSMNPAAPCESCQPDSDSLGWSPFVGFFSGTCPAGQFCSSSGCRPGCFIDGGELEPDDVDPENLCLSCQPALTPSGWTHLGDGAACDAGGVCIQGLCKPACAIGGQTFPPGALDSSNPCLSCLPDQTTVSWSPISGPAGAGCDSTAVCNDGACVAGCFIDGGFTGPGTDPSDPCRSCDPSKSTTSWSPALDGTACQGASFCSGGSCLAGCFIKGAFYAAGASDPTNICRVCRPDGCNQYDWSDAPSGTVCEPGGVCLGAQCFGPPYATCLPAGGACVDGGLPCCSSIDAGLLGGCSATGICGCLPVGQYLGYNTSCLTPAPACCSTVCVADNYDGTSSCSCYDAGVPCTADVQCCGGCCAGGFCN
jgi:hypothetical protein